MFPKIYGNTKIRRLFTKVMILSQHPPLQLALPSSPTASHPVTVAPFYVTRVGVALVEVLAQLASPLMHGSCTYTNRY